jgi:hypothetical protein
MKHPHLNLDPSLVRKAVPFRLDDGHYVYRCPKCSCILPPPSKEEPDLTFCPGCKTPCEIAAAGD